MSAHSPAGGTTYRPSNTANEEDSYMFAKTHVHPTPKAVAAAPGPGARFREYATAGRAARRILDEIAAEEDRSAALAIGPSGRPVQYDALGAALRAQTDALHDLAEQSARFTADNQTPPKKLVDELLDAATRLSLTVEQAERVAGYFEDAAEIHPTLYRNACKGLKAEIAMARTALEG